MSTLISGGTRRNDSKFLRGLDEVSKGQRFQGISNYLKIESLLHLCWGKRVESDYIWTWGLSYADDAKRHFEASEAMFKQASEELGIELVLNGS
jgi:hypothetical protein